MKLTQRDDNQISVYEHDEDRNAKRVIISGWDIQEGNINLTVNETKTVDTKIVEVEKPVYLIEKQIEIKEVEKPFLVYETKVLEVEKIVYVDKIKEIFVDKVVVVEKEVIKVIEVDKLTVKEVMPGFAKWLLIAQTILILGILVTQIVK